MKRLACLTAALLTVAPVSAASTTPTELIGQLEPQLVLDTRMQIPIRMATLTAEQAAALPAPLAEGDKAFGGTASHLRTISLRVVLVEPKEGQPFLYVDRDQDGKLAAEERFPLVPAGGSAGGTKSAAMGLPLATGLYSSYPLQFSRIPDDELNMPPAMRGKADAILMAASSSYLQGRVPVEGKEILVRLPVSYPLKAVDPRNNTVQMDVDADGTIDSSPGSLESDSATDGDAVFHIGERYVSVESVDLDAGKMVLRSRLPADYLRLSLAAGSALPDFSFVDLEGKPHKLSDWRGRYLLLDFWSTWCVPCIAEFPTLKKAFEEYRPRGFDVVGVLYVETDEKARKFLEEPANRLPWIHATAASTEEMAVKRLRIRSIPALILLDPEGKVVSAGHEGQPPLSGEELMETLAKLLPKKAL
jgi:thiol-disulfide isomerase/thioredoxin